MLGLHSISPCDSTKCRVCAMLLISSTVPALLCRDCGVFYTITPSGSHRWARTYDPKTISHKL